MRILFVTSSSGSRGGGELHLCFLAEELVKGGHQVALWASAHPKMDDLCHRFQRVGDVLRSNYRNTYDRPLRSFSGSLSPTVADCFLRKWTGWKPDVVHFNKQNLEDGLDLLALAERLSSPHACTIHLPQLLQTLGAVFGGLRDKVAQYALRSYPGSFITPALRRSQELSVFLGRQVATIVNGVPTRTPEWWMKKRVDFRAQWRLCDDDKLVVSIGRFAPQKQPLRFLDEAALIRQAWPRSRFTWVGSGGGSGDDPGLRRQWRERIRLRKLEGCVTLQSWTMDPTSYLAAADLYLHPAIFEGMPYTILEAMAAGVPVATTSELRREVECLTDQNSLLLGAGTLVSILRNGSELREVTAKGRQMVEQHFSLRTMAQSHLALYESLLTPVAPP